MSEPEPKPGAESPWSCLLRATQELNSTADLRQARVLVSIRDHEEERDRMIAKLRRHRGEIQQHINRTLTLRYTPKLHFELDSSIEQGDRVLNLLLDMEREDEGERQAGSSEQDDAPQAPEEP